MFSNKFLHKLSIKLRIESQPLFAQYLAELITSPLEVNQKAAQELFLDATLARGRLWAEAVAKFAHFQQLPWKLFQLCHWDQQVVMQGAQQALSLFKLGGFGVKHQQSRRFLDPSWIGGNHDPPLRPFIEKIAVGEPITSPDMNPLILWLGRLSCVRLAERSVEGVHAVLTRALKKAPHSSIPYLSIEVRFKNFWSKIVSDPPVTCQRLMRCLLWSYMFNSLQLTGNRKLLSRTWCCGIMIIHHGTIWLVWAWASFDWTYFYMISMFGFPVPVPLFFLFKNWASSLMNLGR